MNPPDSDLIYDWNRAGGAVYPTRGRVEIDDETLRDGLQSPSVKSPSIDQKIRILHLMEALGHRLRRHRASRAPGPTSSRR